MSAKGNGRNEKLKKIIREKNKVEGVPKTTWPLQKDLNNKFIGFWFVGLWDRRFRVIENYLSQFRIHKNHFPSKIIRKSENP